MGTVSAQSEAMHSELDLLASVIAYYAVGKAETPDDKRHPYGHGKWENVSNIIEALLIFAAAAYIIYEAIIRLTQGSRIEHLWLGTAVMAISAAVNRYVSARIFKVAKKPNPWLSRLMPGISGRMSIPLPADLLALVYR
jgi:cation diffusion facilitator family transporter